jgi:hypothetical protein
MWSITRQRITLLFCIVGICCAPTSVRAGGPHDKNKNEQAAPPPSSIQLLGVDKGDLTLNWDDLINGRSKFTLWNHSDTPVEVNATLCFPFATSSNTTAAPIELVLAQNSLRIEKGQTASFTISLRKPKSKPKPGLYFGVLKFQPIKPVEATTTMQLRIMIPDPRPGMDHIYVIARRGAPWWKSWSANAEFPLATPYATSLSDTPQIVGFLHRNPEDWASVKWIRVGGNDTAPTAVIQIEGLSSAGTYEGNINLTGAQDKTSPALLTLTAKDLVIWPILTIIVGIGLAWTAKRYVGVLRIAWELRKQEAEIGATLREAQRNFSDLAVGEPFSTYSIAEDVAAKRRAIIGHLDSLDKTWTTSVDKDPNYEAITLALPLLQAQLAQWPALASACVSLKVSIEGASKHIDKSVMIPTGVLGLPTLLTSAKGQLDGKPIATAEVAPLSKAILDSAARVRAWDEANRYAVEISTEYKSLAIPGVAGQQNLLGDVRNHLITVWGRLWRAITDDELAAITAAGGDLDSAGIAIEQFVADTQRIADYAPNKPAAMFAPNGSNNLSIFRQLPESDYSLHLPADDTRRSELLRSTIRFGDTASAIFALIIALVTGLSANYWGRSFGTLQDYAVLFLWAAGTKVGLDIVTALTDRFVSSG